jgi:hypothetical protein
MRILEARFHPQKKSGTALVVVGRIRCEGPRTWLEPAEVVARDGLDGTAVAAMRDKLRYLVETSGPQPFERLLRLTSDFWSFVEIQEE